MKNDGSVHDVLLLRNDGSKRIFRIYARPLPEAGRPSRCQLMAD